MLRSPSPSIRSRARRSASPLAPAIALIETLVAAAILAVAALAFLFVFKEARTDLARAKRQTEAAALARDLLAETPETWLSGPYSGERAGFGWRRRCLAEHDVASPRLLLMHCTVSIDMRTAHAPTISLDAQWAVERPGARRL